MKINPREDEESDDGAIDFMSDQQEDAEHFSWDVDLSVGWE